MQHQPHVTTGLAHERASAAPSGGAVSSLSVSVVLGMMKSPLASESEQAERAQHTREPAEGRRSRAL